MRVAQVGDALEALEPASVLRHLQFSGNNVGTDGAIALAEGVKGKGSFEVIFLSSYNRVGL